MGMYPGYTGCIGCYTVLFTAFTLLNGQNRPFTSLRTATDTVLRRFPPFYAVFHLLHRFLIFFFIPHALFYLPHALFYAARCFIPHVLLLFLIYAGASP